TLGVLAVLWLQPAASANGPLDDPGAALVVAGCASPPGLAVQGPYSGTYSINDLCAVPGLPEPYGGLTFLPGDSNTILIGGVANYPTGTIYSVKALRDAGKHIAGFAAPAAVYAGGAYNDVLAIGPGNVLFYSRFPINQIGEVKPGETTTAKIVNLTPLSVTA